MSLRRLPPWIATCALVACGGELPGDLVGDYAVTGTLVDHTCGEQALPAADPMRFDVELREDNGQGFWIVQPPAHTGTLSPDGAFHFESESTQLLSADRVGVSEPDPEREADPELAADPERFEAMTARAQCTLRIHETIRGTVHRPDADAGTNDVEADLTGENEIQVRAAADTDCDFALEAQGGIWEQLPCRVSYDLAGVLLATGDTAPR